MDRLEQAETILIGERHGFAPHQNRVALILEELALRGRFPTLALEMLEPAQMPALETYRADNPEYVGGLGAALNWSETGWPAWSFYEPVFRAAFRAKLEVMAADLPKEEQRLIRRTGETSLDYSQIAYEEWIKSIAEALCLDPSSKFVRHEALRQIARDQHIANSIDSVPGHAVLVAGGEHIRSDRVIGALGKQAETLGFMPDQASHTHYDYVWKQGHQATNGC
ncbi:ChaN family lipoprotein [Tateyamaria armeniaca]|uniref:ChaN family lipoprotein n=1 Tax=Tateyamaria armeniaca TaxID=2518930 RepID=A0ABW8UT84_9RHOB